MARKLHGSGPTWLWPASCHPARLMGAPLVPASSRHIRWRTVVVFTLLAASVPSTAQAQSRVGSDSATRLTRYGRDLAYGTVAGLAFAALDQARNDPPEWGRGSTGYLRRAASDVGAFAVQETVTDLLAAALDRPLDYPRCSCTGVGSRAGWALASAVTDVRADGRRAPAVPRLVGAYAGSFAQSTWRPVPAGGSATRTALVNGTTSLLLGAAINLWYEFRPAWAHLP